MDLFIEKDKINRGGYYDYSPSNYLDIYDLKVFNARRNLITKGYFNCIINPLNNILKKYGITNKIVLDAGCGECALYNELLDNTKYGIDLSKDAIEYASNTYKDIYLSIANINNLPFKDNTFDCALNIFALKNYEEFTRVLKEDGIMIKVIPIDDSNKYTISANQKLIDDFFNHYDYLEQENIKEELPLHKDDYQDYIEMNPELFIYDNFEEINTMSWNVSILVGRVKK